MLCCGAVVLCCWLGAVALAAAAVAGCWGLAAFRLPVSGFGWGGVVCLRVGSGRGLVVRRSRPGSGSASTPLRGSVVSVLVALAPAGAFLTAKKEAWLVSYCRSGPPDLSRVCTGQIELDRFFHNLR